MAEVGWIRTVGLLPLLPARQTEDECREVRLQTGIATSIKRQPCWLTRLRLRPGRVETSGSRVRQDAVNPIKEPARKLDSQVSDFSPGISVERYTLVFQTGIVGALPTCPSIFQERGSVSRSTSECWWGERTREPVRR